MFPNYTNPRIKIYSFMVEEDINKYEEDISNMQQERRKKERTKKMKFSPSSNPNNSLLPKIRPLLVYIRSLGSFQEVGL